MDKSGNRTILWSYRSEHKPAFSGVMKFDNKPHNFVQTGDAGVVLTSSAGSDVFLGRSFTAGDIGQFGNFATVFDQYRIMSIEVWLTPIYQDIAGGNSASEMYTVIDYDDANTPSSASPLLQYTNVTSTTSYEGVYRKWRPHIPAATNSLSQLQNKVSTWIDVASTAVPHYGLKIAVKSSTVTTTYNMTYRIWVQFKNVF